MAVTVLWKDRISYIYKYATKTEFTLCKCWKNIFKKHIIHNIINYFFKWKDNHHMISEPPRIHLNQEVWRTWTKASVLCGLATWWQQGQSQSWICWQKQVCHPKRTTIDAMNELPIYFIFSTRMKTHISVMRYWTCLLTKRWCQKWPSLLQTTTANQVYS